MMYKYIVINLMVLGIVCLSCNSIKKDKAVATETAPTTALQAQTIEKKYANYVDPICDMALPAIAKDTAIVEDKVYGFCSKECKEEFVKAMVAQKLR